VAGNILSRPSFYCGASKLELTPTQGIIDEAVEHFTDQACDGHTLAAVTAGGIAHRLGRWLTLQAVSPFFSEFSSLLRLLAGLGGTTAESGVFLGSSELLRPSSLSSFPQNFTSTFLTFGTLRAFGKLTFGQNLLVQHLFADIGLLTSRRLSALLGFGEKPTGSLGDQWVESEVLNWQMKAGMALSARLFPQVVAFERRVDFSASFLISKSSLPFLLSVAFEGSEVTKKSGRDLISLWGPSRMSIFDDSPERPFDPYRDVDPATRRLKLLFEHADGLRRNLLLISSQEGKQKVLEEYQALSKGFPSTGPEIYEEISRWSQEFMGSPAENTPFLLEAYRSAVLPLRKGGFHLYQEALGLCQKVNSSATQLERWRMLKGLEILAPRFGDGHPEVYEIANSVRGLFRYPSAHTQRQAFETYRALVPHFEAGNQEIAAARMNIMDLYEELEPKTQDEARATLEEIEKKLPFLEQLRIFFRNWRNFPFLRRDPKI
jgi:hypothetical protein